VVENIYKSNPFFNFHGNFTIFCIIFIIYNVINCEKRIGNLEYLGLLLLFVMLLLLFCSFYFYFIVTDKKLIVKSSLLKFYEKEIEISEIGSIDSYLTVRLPEVLLISTKTGIKYRFFTNIGWNKLNKLIMEINALKME
jgi:hypothetical protein